MTLHFRRWGLAGLVAAALAGGCAEVPPPTFSQKFEPVDAATEVTDMGRGVNVLDNDPAWTDPGNARFKPRLFQTIRRAGFSNVRIVLEAFGHMEGKDNRLPAHWLKTLDEMVGAALDAGLTVVIDEHDYNFCGKHADECGPKLDAFWAQVAPRYRDAPNRVVFEVLNEPFGEMTAERWNRQLVETLSVIRASNPARNVIVGPASWNSLDQLAALQLPADDRHIVVTFHYYLPMTFTHQGASWVESTRHLSGVHWGTEAEYDAMRKDFDRVKAWSERENRPIFLGEFGAYEAAPFPDRLRWTWAAARTAEAHGFAWAYWYFDGGFTVYDIDRDRWIEPILNVLIPKT